MAEMKDSGIEWIGKIPEDWDVIRCKYISTFLNGYAFDSKDLQMDFMYPVIRIGDIKNGGIDTINCQGVNNNYDIKDYLIKENDILLAMSGATVGKVGIAHNIEKAYINQRVGIIRTDCPPYLFYCLSTKEFVEYILLCANGSAQPNVSADVYREFSIPLPPKEMKVKIADFLDEKCAEMDTLHSDIEKQIHILEEYKKSIITEAVTKGLDPDVEMKDSGIEWIKKIPKHWKTNKIKYLFASGKGLSITKENLIDEGLPVISYGQIHAKANSGVDVNEDLLRFVPYEYQKHNSNCEVKKYDFIFADTSEDYEGCGNCVYKRDDSLLFAGYHSIILHAINQKDNRYLAYLFLTDLWRKQLRETASGVKVFSVTQKNLINSSITLPPEDEQNKIANILDKKCSEIINAIDDKKQQLETLEQYKKSLIYEYVTGKKEVQYGNI